MIPINFPYSLYPNPNLNLYNPNPLFFPQHQNNIFQYQNGASLMELLAMKNHLQRQLMNSELHNLAKMNPYSLSPLPDFASRNNSSLKENLETTSPMIDLPNDSNIRTEAQIKYMIQFFVNNHGIIKDNEMQSERLRYSHDKKLLKLFDTLNRKYTSTTKTKEELIKWIIRRAIKSGINQDQEDENLKRPLEDLQNEDQDQGEYEIWIESLLPFKKSSKNKTMNSQFLTEIFASEKFRIDYHNFLIEMEKVIEEDTTDKMRRFLQFAIDCVNKDTMEKILKYRRVPWLKKWGMNARKVALQIKPKNFHNQKKCLHL